MTEQVFVGINKVSLEQLKQLLSNLSADKPYYFLRWIHEVKGFHPFNNSILSDLSPEGQIFNADWELRWRKQGEFFDLLLLSSVGKMDDFYPLKMDDFHPLQPKWIWEYKNRDAIVHPNTETRFLQSKSLSQNLAKSKVTIKQRYFIHKQTSTIHFIALTVSNS